MGDFDTQTDQSASFLDVLTGAASSAASSVVTGAGDSLSNRVSEIIDPGSGVVSDGKPFVGPPAPVNATNKPQPGVVLPGGISVPIGIAAAVAGYFLFVK